MNETIDTNISYTPDELCAIVEALYEAISNRFRWTVSTPEEYSGAEAWQELDIDVARAAIDMLVAAYSKTVLTLRTWPTDAIDPAFLAMFSLPREVWDLLAEITNASSWDNVPRHDVDPNDKECPVCRFLMSR